MPAAPDPITSTPSLPWQPYDTTAPDGSDVGGWVKSGHSGPADPATMDTHGDWPDGPGPWRQT